MIDSKNYPKGATMSKLSRINKLKKKLTDSQASQVEIEAKLQIEYNSLFEESFELNEAVKAAECSNDYAQDESGDIVSWARIDCLEKFENCKEYLENWLRNGGICLDWKNNALLCFQGHCIVIYDDGNVYDTDSGKCFISKSDYTLKNDGTEQEFETTRNRLIEEYMERTGYFPGVFRIDRHGNVFPVKTTG